MAKAQDLAVEIYSIFKNLKDFGFKDQICRAAISISNNIAEGFERNTNPDFLRFLYIALGSCSEVKSMVYISIRLNDISKEQLDKFISQLNEISKIMNGLIKSLI